MDGFQMAATSIGVIGIILLIVLLVLHFFGPKTAAWIHSNREEKCGLSNSKPYHANGFLIQSGSEFLLNSTGSFKRFDSIDRDYKPISQTSLHSPSWRLNVPEIPPQPLRPAPAPVSPSFKEATNSLEKLSSHQQSSNERDEKCTVIPRPFTRRQHSSPAGYGVTHINLSDAVAKIVNGPRSCTNPFLNGSLSISTDNNLNSTGGKRENHNILNDNSCVAEKELQQNPFTRRNNEQPIFSFPSTNGNIVKYDEIVEDIREVNNGISGAGSGDSLIQFTNEYVDGHEPNNGSDTLNDVTNLYQSEFRNRSLSDPNSGDLVDVRGTTAIISSEEKSTSNPFVAGNLHKTLSDTFLEQYSMHKNTGGGGQTWAFGRSSRQSASSVVSNDSSNGKVISSSQNSINSNETDLKRAMSCDSVNSESSVILADLEQQTVPLITGLLCVGLQYDKNTMTDEGIELIVTIMEAKKLIGPSNVEQFDTFVRIYLVPDETAALQTKLFKDSKCPTYNETISFWLSKKRTKRSLWFHLYHSGSINTLIGETEFQIGDVRRPITTWLSLSDSRHNNSPNGELMFSLSYLPTAERLTVVVVKARNLKLSEESSSGLSAQNIFVKVYLLKDDKKVSKKKTSVKRSDCSPIYNESMIFSVPPYMLGSIQVRLTVVGAMESNSIENSNTIGSVVKPIGHVIVGCATSGKGLRHWNQMLTSLRKPVAMWHAVRQSSTSSVKTGKSS